MKWFAISIIIFVSFGWVHFITDKWIYKLWPERYPAIKFWIGKVTILLTISVVGSLLWTLVKFLMQKK